MIYKFNALSAPVSLEEIERKLPVCSMFCAHDRDCPFRVTLDTVNPDLVIEVCLNPDKREVKV